MTTAREINLLVNNALEFIANRELVGKYIELEKSISVSNNELSMKILGNIMTLNGQFDDECKEFKGINILNKLGMQNVIGREANKRLCEINLDSIFNKSENRSIVIQTIKNLRNFEINLKMLKNTFQEIKEFKVTENKTEILLYFKESCNVTKLNELEKVASEWQKVFKLLYEISDETPPEDIEFSNIEKGSLKLTIPLFLLGVLNFTKLAEASQNILKKNIENNKIYDEFRRDGIDEDLIQQLIEKRKPNKISTIFNNEITEEQKVKIDKLIEPTLISFFKKGGEIKVFLNEKDKVAKEGIEVLERSERLKIQAEEAKELYLISNNKD